ncbi:hypothetical protein HNP46_007166 [Pseudomonas nitritireducens]|uniref:Uncharacterized protein n=1 Tax=Pseudomonas nitroreducens TaxID=46680 RepID=A0A7W7KT55_PSENT|nr:hypothetical protein [Pseudomonas nitritireducens]
MADADHTSHTATTERRDTERFIRKRLIDDVLAMRVGAVTQSR